MLLVPYVDRANAAVFQILQLVKKQKINSKCKQSHQQLNQLQTNSYHHTQQQPCSHWKSFSMNLFIEYIGLPDFIRAKLVHFNFGKKSATNCQSWTFFADLHTKEMLGLEMWMSHDVEKCGKQRRRREKFERLLILLQDFGISLFYFLHEFR